MASVDERAAAYRRRMIGSLAERGITDEAVLRALYAVPRHQFVTRFWTMVPDGFEPGQPRHQGEFVLDDRAGDEVLALVYDPDRALAISGPFDRQAVTSSLSAPDIVATMLVESHLRPGLHVLEIGTGSGYHAVLMARLVGNPARVTTIDIDPSVVETTARRVIGLGFGAMSVRYGDGALGASDAAPFDRIVATVGCADLSSAWIDQLADDGEVLIPLDHGGLHPRVQVRRDDGLSGRGLVGRFTGHSGFVRIRGIQGEDRHWPSSNPPLPTPEAASSEPLPAALRHVLSADARRARGNSAPWDLGIYLALRDRRASFGPILTEHGSLAAVRDRGLVVDGPHGAQLRDRLLELALEWAELGAPGLAHYAMSFAARSSPEAVRAPGPADSATGPWQIDRASYRQTTWLAS
jgi:protein-L-isoaspartate(D-aspartate) O-methyltransferase